MTRVTHTQIEITKNPLMKIPVEVPQWEAHVVLALWGEDANVTGTIVRDRKIPEVNDEFARLANKYGPRDEDIPFVARVYGGFGPGLRALANEFDVSIAGSIAKSTAAQVSAVRPDQIAPVQLAGFEGSKAPTAPGDIDETSRMVVEDVPELTVEDEPFQVPVSDADAAAIDAAVGSAGGLSDAEIDAIDKVPALAGNTVDGVPVKEFLNDVSDLTGEGGEPEAA